MLKCMFLFKYSVIMVIAVLMISLFSTTSQAVDPIVVGGKNFTEQYLLSELAKTLLEANGLPVMLKTGVGSAVVRRSLVNHQIDLYYEYTGSAYTVYHKQSDRDVMTDPQKVYEWVKTADARLGLVWLHPVKFNNTYTLMMRERQAKKLEIVSISDLSNYINKYPDKLVVGVNAEFWERPDGFKPLMKTYGFRLPYDKVRKMDSGLVYQALRDKNVDVSMGFATDGRIEAFGFITLKDDQHYFPAYHPAPVVREAILKQYPDIPDILKPIAEHLTTREIRRLNASVDVSHEDISTVARQWLESKGLLK